MRGLGGLSRTLPGGAAALILATLAGAAPARAEDGGFFGFLRALGGGDQQPAAAPQPAAEAPQPHLRPLTVRRSKPRAAAPAHARFARLPEKTGPVTIYTDPTLRGGDAVMTKDGVRVFAGAPFTAEHPYTDSDFVAVSAAKSVNPNLRKTVTDLNKLPHG